MGARDFSCAVSGFGQSKICRSAKGRRHWSNWGYLSCALKVESSAGSLLVLFYVPKEHLVFVFMRGRGGRGPFLYSCINLRVSYALCDDGKNRRLGYLVFSESVSANSDRHCSSILPLKSTNVTIWQSVGYFASLFSFNNNNNNNNNSLFMYQII